MLKILSTNQIRELDAYTIEHRPIASIDLMENACRAIVTWFTERYNSTCKVGVVCGTGNNGGDGLGVARMLNGCWVQCSGLDCKGKYARVGRL